MGYRERVTSRGREPTMAVVVQVMVSARSSGVMFTANPVTSDHDEMVINAHPGLGTLVVAGHVTPDTYTLNKATLRMRERDIAQKIEMMVAEREGTRVVPVPERQRRTSTLSRRQCSELGRLGRRIERHFGSPQDIEYVHDGKQFWVVQSRPVTGLASWEKPRKGTAWSRHSFTEFMPRPLSPLFETTYLPIMSDFMRKLAGEWGIVARGTRPVVVTLNGYAFLRGDARLSIVRLAGAPVTALRYLANFWRHRWRCTLLEPYALTVENWKDLDAEHSSPARLWQGVTEICRANANYWRACMQNRVSGLIEEAFVRIYPLLVRKKERVLVSVFLRGHDSEPARAERELWLLAQDIREQPELRSLFVESSADDIEARLQKSPSGREFLCRFRDHREHNGYQVSTLDFMDPTLGESPGPLLARIKLFLAQEDSTPRFERARQERLAAEAQLKAALGSFRRTLLSWILGLLDYALVLREDVLFFLGLGWPVVRRFILELGKRMVRDGLLDVESDVFFTTETELKELFSAVPPKVNAGELKRNVERRRERWKEQLRLKPPVLIPSHFRVFGFRMSRFMPEHVRAGSGNQILGIPVSPGRVTGPAFVIGSPEEFCSMKAGGILVAPMTSPAWTPLLAMASGVVTDVGSLLSHTSIVAREYGIPAVIGTGVATRRIANGQIVTVDGDCGNVTLGEPTPESQTPLHSV
jgi:rifampicin phosphotransferase